MDRSFSRRPYALLLLIFTHFCVDFYGSFLSPLQPFLISRHHLTLVKAGFLVTLYSISASLMQPVYGYLADRIRRNAFVVAGPFFAAIFMCMLPHATGYGLLMICLLLGGVGVASFHPQASAMSHEVSGKRKGVSMSMFISGGNFGAALGPLVLMFLINRAGADSTYWLAVPGILFSLCLVFLAPAPARKDTSDFAQPPFRQLRNFMGPLGHLYGIVVFRTLVQLSFLHYTPILFKQMNFSGVSIGFAVTAFMSAGAIGGVVGGFLYDRWGGRNLFLFSTVTAALFLSAMQVFGNGSLMIPFFALGGFFLMMTIPVSVLMGQSIVPNAISTVSSVMMGFGWGTGGLLIPLVGALADATSIQSTLQLLALVPLLYLPFAWKLPKTTHKGKTHPEISYPVLES
jgi:MFS transporter, FSR family, fosmidomycin resistance protein